MFAKSKKPDKTIYHKSTFLWHVQKIYRDIKLMVGLRQQRLSANRYKKLIGLMEMFYDWIVLLAASVYKFTKNNLIKH